MGFGGFPLPLVELLCTSPIQTVACMCNQETYGLRCPSLTWLDQHSLDLVRSACHVGVCEEMVNGPEPLVSKSQQW